jgi:hypothetical protein
VSPEISERSFEEAIERMLLANGPDALSEDSALDCETEEPYGEMIPGGYRRRNPEEYDPTLCLLPRDVVDFVLATQPSAFLGINPTS